MGWGFCHSRSLARGSGFAVEAKSHGLVPVLLLGLAWMGAACAGYGTGGTGPELSENRPKTEFSGARVVQNERKLAPDPADETVKDCPSVSERLIPSLKAMGASIQEAPPDPEEGVDVGTGAPEAATVALLKGASSDPILLIAPYTEACSGRDPRSSQFGSAAFLLELGRVLSTHPMRYSIWLIFVPESMDEGGGPRQPGSLEPAPWPALTRVVSHFEKSGVLERVRVAIFFEGLGLPNSSAHRDSHSHPIYREVFWESARDLGLTDLFPEDADYFAVYERFGLAGPGAESSEPICGWLPAAPALAELFVCSVSWILCGGARRRAKARTAVLGPRYAAEHLQARLYALDGVVCKPWV